MQTRREFLSSTAAGLAAIGAGPLSLLEPRALAKKMDRLLGVQLYTVRSLMDDLAGTLKAVRKIGYTTGNYSALLTPHQCVNGSLRRM